MTKSYPKKLKGFTLLEILIGTAIFATVMVITTGVVSNSAGFQTKLRTIREISNEGQQIADQISQSVRETNGDFSLGNLTYQQGIALYNCSSGSAVPIISTVLLTDAVKPDTLVTFSKNKGKYQIYGFRDDKIVYEETNGFTNVCDEVTSMMSSVSGSVISNSNYSYSLSFAGFAPDSTVTDQKAYLTFNILVSSKNYDALLPNERAKIEIKSSVVSRISH